MVPLPMQVPGPTAALKLAGSQGPCIRITVGLLVATTTTAAANGIIAIVSWPHFFQLSIFLSSVQMFGSGMSLLFILFAGKGKIPLFRITRTGKATLMLGVVEPQDRVWSCSG